VTNRHIRLLGHGPTGLSDLLERMQQVDQALNGPMVELIVTRIMLNEEVIMEEIVFEGEGSIPELVHRVWEAVSPEQSGLLESERREHGLSEGARYERRERSNSGGARSARGASATSAGNLAALAALAPSSD